MPSGFGATSPPFGSPNDRRYQMAERLTARVLFKPEEGLFHYLTRIAAANGFDCITAPDALRPSISLSDHSIRSDELAYHTGLSKDDVQRVLPERVAIDAVKYHGVIIPSEMLNLRSTRVCTACLSDGHTHWTWQVLPLEVCSIHRMRLTDGCNRCPGSLDPVQRHFECTRCVPPFEQLLADHPEVQLARQLNSLSSQVSQQPDFLSDWLFAWRYVSRAAVRSGLGRDVARDIVVGRATSLANFVAFTTQLVHCCKPSPSDSAWAREAKLRLRHLARVSGVSFDGFHLAQLPYVDGNEATIQPVQPVLPGLEAFISSEEAERTTGLRADDLLDRYEKHFGGAFQKNDDGQLEFDIGTVTQLERAETRAGNISRRSSYRGGMTQRALAEHLGLTVRDLRQLREAGLLVQTHNANRSILSEQSWRALIQYMSEISVLHLCDPAEYDSSIDLMNLSKFRKFSRVSIIGIIEKIERNEITCIHFSENVNSFYDLFIDAKPFGTRLRRRQELVPTR